MSRLTLGALLAVVAEGKHCTVGELARATGLPPVSADGLLRRLESAGLIAQAGHRQSATWTITRRGSAALARMNEGSK